ncbi:hypothetical protein WA158_003177 [Blastocystis sp. Blastoise]
MKQLLVFAIFFITLALSESQAQITGDYEAITKFRENNYLYSFTIVGEKSVSSISEIIEYYYYYEPYNVLLEKPTIIETHSSVSNAEIVSIPTCDPWFHFHLNTHTVLITIQDSAFIQNNTHCFTSILLNKQYNVMDLNCTRDNEDIFLEYKHLIENNKSMRSNFMFKSDELYYGNAIYKRVTQDNPNNYLLIIF